MRSMQIRKCRLGDEDELADYVTLPPDAGFHMVETLREQECRRQGVDYQARIPREASQVVSFRTSPHLGGWTLSASPERS